MTPHDIDDLFKKGAEQYEFSYRPDAWQRMDKMLDKQRRDRRRWLLLVLLLIGLVGGGAGYYWTSTGTGSQHQLRPTPVQTHPTQAEFNSSSSPSSVAEQGPSPNTQISPTTKALQGSESVLPGKDEIAQLQNENRSPKRERRNRFAPKAQQPTSSKVAETTPTRQSNSTDTTTPPSSFSGSRVFNEDVTSQTPNRHLPVVSSIPTLHFQLHKERTNEDFPTPIAQEDVKHNLRNTGFRWAAAPLLSADWNSVGLLDQTRMGWRAGVAVEARIGNKWSIGTGATYGSKNYVAARGEYKGSSDFWVDQVYPETTDAKCKVLQMPLLLSYYKNGFDQAGFFASAGLTSFFMSREKFNFNYAEAPPPNAPTEWEEKWTNKHIFGVGQIHLGYQGKINNALFWQISPYAQLPVGKGIGHGTVDLHSYGLQLNLKFIMD